MCSQFSVKTHKNTTANSELQVRFWPKRLPSAQALPVTLSKPTTTPLHTYTHTHPSHHCQTLASIQHLPHASTPPHSLPTHTHWHHSSHAAATAHQPLALQPIEPLVRGHAARPTYRQHHLRCISVLAAAATPAKEHTRPTQGRRVPSGRAVLEQCLPGGVPLC